MLLKTSGMLIRLVESENKSVSEHLRRFSDLMNLNHLGLLQKEVNSLKSIRNIKYNSLVPSLIITPIVNSFITRFGNIKSHAVFQLQLAKWQYEHHNYTAAYISLIESIITYICDVNGKDWDDYNMREEAKKALKSSKSTWKVDDQLTQIFREMNKVRNSLAHTLETNKSAQSMIGLLKENLQALGKTIK